MRYYLCPFVALFPTQGMAECRVLHVRQHATIPDDDYALSESYCPDPDCDCRRVMLNVMPKTAGGVAAVISFGFDRTAEDAGPFLDPLNPQGSHADALLALVSRVVLSDAAYIARLEAHYQQVKAAVKKPSPAVRQVMRRYRVK